MSSIVRTSFMLVCITAALVGTFVLGLSRSTPGLLSAGEGSGGLSLADSSGSFTIEGVATESISPGLAAPLDLKLTNSHATPMVISNLRVKVQKVAAPHADETHPCTIGDFTVDNAASRHTVTIAAESTNTLSRLGLPMASWPHIGMLNRPVDQDGCKGASLTLAYAASGTAKN
ncbi:MAG: hypothetical protein QOE58_1333 [Actinomycetota bacterium]|jgi:hypothetical protein|nr:hypothetical protein [Actinomycetota bacterium]